MLIFFLIIGLAACIFCITVALLVLQVQSGQLDDLDTPPMRMLGEDSPWTKQQWSEGVNNE